MKHNIFLFLIVVLSFTSCSTFQYSSRSTAINTQNIVATPTVVDVKADYTKRIIATSSRCKTPQDAQNEAKYMAITQNQIDIVVDPIYKIERRNRRYQATLTGFAGYFINARSFYEDVKLLKDIDRTDIEKYLILHNPEVLQYMQENKEDVINIYHTEGADKSDKSNKAK